MNKTDFGFFLLEFGCYGTFRVPSSFSGTTKTRAVVDCLCDPRLNWSPARSESTSYPPPLSLSLSPGRWVSNSVASAGLGVAAAAATVAWWASLLPKNYQFFLFFLVKTCFFRGVFFVFFLGSGEESVLSVSRLYWVYWWFIFWVNGFSCLCRLLDFNVRQAGFIWTELGFCQVSPIHYHARLNFIRVVRFVNFTQPWSLSIFISFQWAGMKQKDYIGFSLASHVVIRVALPDFISLIFLLSLKHP